LKFYGIDAVANEIDVVFQKISNLFVGPFAADVEKLALVCFSFVLFFAESTRVVCYYLLKFQQQAG
jgi:hypothetical protein